MSADDYIFINKRKKPYKVWHCVASCVSGKFVKEKILGEVVKVLKVSKKDMQKQKSYLIGTYKTLRGAIEGAEKYEKENPGAVEYGVSFNLWCK